MQYVECAHQVVAAGDLLRGHKQDSDVWGSLLQPLHDAARILVVLCATEVAAGDASLLQVKHLQGHRHMPGERSGQCMQQNRVTQMGKKTGNVLCSSGVTWSWMRDTRGLMTTVTPVVSSAGSW